MRNHVAELSAGANEIAQVRLCTLLRAHPKRGVNRACLTSAVEPCVRLPAPRTVRWNFGVHKGLRPSRLSACFSAAALAVVALTPLPAASQGAFRRGAATAPEELDSSGQEADVLVTLRGPQYGAPTATDADDDGDAEDGGQSDDVPGARSQRSQRAAEDGDVAEIHATDATADGVIVVGEPEPLADGGGDSAHVDAVGQEDIAPLESLQSGFYSLLFQIEDIEPLQDRRPERLFQFEPFDPVGVRVGSFVLFPEIELAGVYSSNVFSSPDARSDTALEARPSARLVSNWSTHALELMASGDLSAHEEFSSEDDQAYALEARGRLDIVRGTNIEALVSRSLTQERRSAIDASPTGDRADITTDRAAVTINHRFNRLSLQLRGAVDAVDYSPVDSGGVTVSNDDRDETIYGQAVRATWEFKPTLFVFSELAASERTFEAPAGDGLKRDSNGKAYRIGVSFGSTSQILRGEASIGYGLQRPEAAGLQEIDGVLIDANVAWRATALTSLLFTARSEIDDTTTDGSSGVLSRLYGVETRHAFYRYLIGSAGINYLTRDYAGVPLKERETALGVGLEYYLNRETILFGRYAHASFETNDPGGDYTTDEVRVGVRLRR